MSHIALGPYWRSIFTFISFVWVDGIQSGNSNNMEKDDWRQTFSMMSLASCMGCLMFCTQATPPACRVFPSITTASISTSPAAFSTDPVPASRSTIPSSPVSCERPRHWSHNTIMVMWQTDYVLDHTTPSWSCDRLCPWSHNTIMVMWQTMSLITQHHHGHVTVLVFDDTTPSWSCDIPCLWSQ